MTLRYRSYAKINLYLDVLNRRRDGIHHIETIFQTVGLHDDLRFTPAEKGISLTCSDPRLPTGEDNLVVRAARLLQRETDTTKGVAIHLEKRIPLAAGLAGGSGNAAATLVALDTLWKLNLAPAKLARLALRLGSDVPYCLRGGTMAATGRGERLTPLSRLRGVWYVLAHPDLAISAGAAYGHPALTRNTRPRFAGRTRDFRIALRALADGDLPRLCFNRLVEPLMVDYPELARLRVRLLRGGCVAALVSGSGPTVFGLCLSHEAARHAAKTLEDVRTTVTHGVPFGIRRTAGPSAG